MSEDDRAQQYFEDIYYKMFRCTMEHDLYRDRRVYDARIHEVNVALGLEKEDEEE